MLKKVRSQSLNFHLDTLEYVNPITVVSSLSPEERIVPPVTFRSGSDSNTSSNKVNFGIDIETTTVKIDNKNYLSPIPTNQYRF